ncbi:hypothetical protein H8959_019925 [Pygathrix nigripes]
MHERVSWAPTVCRASLQDTFKKTRSQGSERWCPSKRGVGELGNQRPPKAAQDVLGMVSTLPCSSRGRGQSLKAQLGNRLSEQQRDCPVLGFPALDFPGLSLAAAWDAKKGQQEKAGGLKHQPQIQGAGPGSPARKLARIAERRARAQGAGLGRGAGGRGAPVRPGLPAAPRSPAAAAAVAAAAAAAAGGGGGGGAGAREAVARPPCSRLPAGSDAPRPGPLWLLKGPAPPL